MLFEYEKFAKQGYVIMDSGASKDIITDAQIAFQKTLKRAKIGDYKFIRVYDDYLGCPNVAGIEMPFHPDIINKSLINLLNISHIPKIAKTVLGDKIKLTLSRYHVTSTYSHIGNWHRDSNVGDQGFILISMFLFDEKGFELIPGSHKDKTNYYDEKIKYSRYKSLPNIVHLSVKAGQILIFNPSLVHRGIVAKDRVNIHFRFEQDLGFILDKDVDLGLDQEGFNKEWLDVLCNKNSIIINPEIKEYKCNVGVKNFLIRCIKTFTHFALFFLPVQSSIFKIIRSQPTIKLRNFLK
jgi:hypothetical protein